MVDVNSIHAITKALHDNDLALAQRLRDQLYSTHPHHSTAELDLAITNDYLDRVTPSHPLDVQPDAHLDDIGD